MSTIKKLIITGKLLLVISFLNIRSEQIDFKIKAGFFNSEFLILNNKKEIGYIRSFELFRFAVLYDFFIFPEFRCKGYGISLLKFACENIRKNKNVTIFIQPGPFDMDANNKILSFDVSERKKRMNQLITLYKKVGFFPVKNWVSKFASFCYWLSQLDENSDYLMVME